jgi:hypothetical protein
MGKCEHPGCSVKNASYGNPYDEHATKCAKHKAPEMIDIKSQKCKHQGCKTRPTYGLIGIKTPTHCADHKLEEMIDVNNKMCVHDGCKTRANFNLKGLSAQYCVEHKTDNMIDVRNKSCIHKECDKQPHFNISGLKIGLYCADHKLEGMIDVINDTCAYPGCAVRPHYNLSGTTTGLYCVEHKTDNMINVTSKTCEHAGCPKQPNFNIPGNKIPIFCATHKSEGMVDVKNKTCEHSGCVTRPSYNIKGKQPAYCGKHKLEGMVDVVHNICVEEGCKTRAGFGRLFQQQNHCTKHKKANEYAKNNPKCTASGCKTRPIYTNVGTNYPERCDAHKLPDDKNVVEKPCKKCGLEEFLNESTLLCNSCNDFDVKKVHKVKEERIGKMLLANEIAIESSDKIVSDGCSKYRPDYVIDRGLYKIIIEVDEHQHNSYAENCECSRMIQLHQDYGGIPLLFVRFNPDTYKDHLGAQISSYTGREAKLLDFINSTKNMLVMSHPLSMCRLYYDGFDGSVKIDPIEYL